MTTTGTCKYCGQVKTIDRVPEGYDPCEDCMAYEDDGVEACENCPDWEENKEDV